MAHFEYSRVTHKRSFLLGMLAVPLLIAAIVGVGAVAATQGGGLDALGYADQSGVLKIDAEQGAAPHLYNDEAAAQAALGRKEIAAYYVVPPGYLASRDLTLVYETEPPGDRLQSDFDEFVRASLTADLPPAARDRLREGFQVTLRSADRSREIDEQGFAGLIVPFAVAFLFMFAGIATGGYLQQAVSDEREGRTVEILTTSLTAEQLIVGKAFGLVAAALTQLLVWSLTVVVALGVVAVFVEEIGRIRPPLGLLGLTALFFLPSFALVSGIMTVVGSIVSDPRQSQQVSAIVNMLFVLPMFFISLLLETPDSPIAVALSVFPTTSLVTMAMRWGLTAVPGWQVALALGLLVGSAGASVWIAPRVFRAGMLLYGQRLAPRHIVQALRTGGR